MKKIKIISILFIILLILLTIGGCKKQVNLSIISGKVVDLAGNPIQGAVITVINVSDADSTSSLSAITNEEGEYSISQVPIGIVIIEVTKTGFNTENSTIKIESDEGYIKNFILIPEGSSATGTFTVYAGEDKTVNPGVQVTFSASATNEVGVVTYKWDFQSDGVFDAQGQTVTNTYTAPGTYTVTLQGIDSQGHIATDTVLVNVVNSTPTNQPPTVWIGTDGNIDSGPAPLTIKFLSYAEDSDGNIVTYIWNFGDGETSTLQFPTHTYTQPGTYNVTLIVTDNQGATGSATLTITVTESSSQ